jgi:hypothetical protein
MSTGRSPLMGEPVAIRVTRRLGSALGASYLGRQVQS